MAPWLKFDSWAFNFVLHFSIILPLTLAVSSSCPAHGSPPLPDPFRAQVGRAPSETTTPPPLSEDVQTLTFVQAAGRSRVCTEVCHVCQMQRKAERKAGRVTLTIWAPKTLTCETVLSQRRSPFEEFLTCKSVCSFDEWMKMNKGKAAFTLRSRAGFAARHYHICSKFTSAVL